jgi:A/G-specific adenine glycosylase
LNRGSGGGDRAFEGFRTGLPAILRPLLAWYRKGHRRLPWRETADPYALWISEIMLQQTQVTTVIPYYHRFLLRFPTVGALAKAQQEEVLKLWEGLGYYKRARQLIPVAQEIVRLGGWPRSARELASLPGIGRSTAGAIASFAFGAREPILDGNVRRVWCRLGAFVPPEGAPGERLLWQLSSEAVKRSNPAQVNQALMELGATVCTPRSPSCPACPLAPRCLALERGQAELYPPPPKPKAPRLTVDVSVAIILRDRRFLVTRRPDDVLLGGLWELPGGKWEPGEDGKAALHRELLEELGIRVRVEAEYPVVKHAYTHFSVRLHPFLCSIAGRKSPASKLPSKWIERCEIGALAFPTGTLKVFSTVWPLALRAAEEAPEWDSPGR